jgi:carboxyl-terminal processing protease
VSGVVARGGTLDPTLTSTERRELQREGRLIVDLLQNLNYTDRQFHQIEAKEMIDRYLESLDPDRLFITRTDADFIHRRFERSLKSVYLLKGDFQPALEIFETLRQRVKERRAWIETWMKTEADLTGNETFAAREGAEPPADAAACDRLWDLRMKHRLIEEQLNGRDVDAAKKEVRRDFARWEKQLMATNATQVRERFLETVIELLDPHSGYFSPEHAEEFQILMRGAVAGAGLMVRLEEGRCYVTEVLPGSAADEQGELQRGDEIVAVAEGNDAWTELGGKRLERVTELLRGEPGTRLRVAYRRGVQGDRCELEVTRKRTVLPAQRARGALVTVPSERGSARRIGWIELPDFYASEEGGEKSSASADVRELIDQLKAQGAEGLVLDLRRNPGGAMNEAVALSGLFIPGGPVLMTKTTDGKIAEESAPVATPAWSGPLTVLVTRSSASASEVFAGAMRFHHRAIVAGSDRTFGKGTVQSYIDLNRSPAHSGMKLPWGTLRVTMQRFYFPDGKSPQRIGAAADIVLTTAIDPAEKSEQDLPHALPSDTVPRTTAASMGGEVAVVSDDMLETLREKSVARQRALSEFELFRQGEELMREHTRKKEFSVNLALERHERDAWEAKAGALLANLRALSAASGFTQQSIEIAAVRKTLDAHLAWTGQRRPADGDAKSGWLRSSHFFVESDDGRLGEVSLGEIDFRRYLSNADELAASFRERSGMTMPVEVMSRVLRALSAQENLDETGLLTELALRCERATPVSVRRGAEGMLQKIVTLEPGMLVGRSVLDVVAREGIRLTADWAELRAATAGPLASAKSGTAKP